MTLLYTKADIDLVGILTVLQGLILNAISRPRAWILLYSVPNNGRFLHPLPEGSLVFSAPRAFLCCPRAIERSSRPEGSIKTPKGRRIPMIPRARGVRITFFHD